MVVLTATDYAQFKVLAVSVNQDHVFARDGITAGIGFHCLACSTGEQLVVRYMQATKPPTFDTDFPTRQYVRDFQVV
jgi:hypothetical protein